MRGSHGVTCVALWQWIYWSLGETLSPSVPIRIPLWVGTRGGDNPEFHFALRGCGKTERLFVTGGGGGGTHKWVKWDLKEGQIFSGDNGTFILHGDWTWIGTGNLTGTIGNNGPFRPFLNWIFPHGTVLSTWPGTGNGPDLDQCEWAIRL